MPPRDPNLPEGTDSIIDGNDGLGGGSLTGGGMSGGTSGGMGGSGSGSSSLGGVDLNTADDMMDDGFAGGDSGFGSAPAPGGSTSAFADKASSSVSKVGSDLSDAASSVAGSSDVQSLKSQATDKAREVAVQGKERANEALDNVSRLVSETADAVDDRLGPQYGDYVRKAGEAIEGFNESIRGKEVDELFDEARSFVRKSPSVAIGVAATIGFLLVRLVKSGMPAQGSDSTDYADGSSKQFGSPPRVDNSYDPIA